jgi:hypothetical protein
MAAPIDAGEIDAPPPADARVPIIEKAEQSSMDDEEADERGADRQHLPPLPPQKVPKTQPRELCSVLEKVVAAAPTRFADLAVTLDQNIKIEMLKDTSGTPVWTAVWPRRKRPSSTELAEVLPIVRGCPVLAAIDGIRETAAGKDEIVWSKPGQPRVTLIDTMGDLHLYVAP